LVRCSLPPHALRRELNYSRRAWLITGWLGGWLGAETALGERRLAHVPHLRCDCGALWKNVPAAERGPFLDTPRNTGGLKAIGIVRLPIHLRLPGVTVHALSSILRYSLAP
jgi:hypothetical protein